MVRPRRNGADFAGKLKIVRPDTRLLLYPVAANFSEETWDMLLHDTPVCKSHSRQPDRSASCASHCRELIGAGRGRFKESSSEESLTPL